MFFRSSPETLQGAATDEKCEADKSSKHPSIAGYPGDQSDQGNLDSPGVYANAVERSKTSSL